MLSEPAGEVDLRLHLRSAEKNEMKMKADFVLEEHACLRWAARHGGIEDIFKTQKDVKTLPRKFIDFFFSRSYWVN